METKRPGLLQRWERLYHRSSIQMILSLSFTAVAVIGMLFFGDCAAAALFFLCQYDGGR